MPGFRSRLRRSIQIPFVSPSATSNTLSNGKGGIASKNPSTGIMRRNCGAGAFFASQRGRKYWVRPEWLRTSRIFAS